MKEGRVGSGASGVTRGGLASTIATGSPAMQSVHPQPSSTPFADGEVIARLADSLAGVESLASALQAGAAGGSSVSQLWIIGSKDEHPMHQSVRAVSMPRIARATTFMSANVMRRPEGGYLGGTEAFDA